jgi:phage-related protein
MVKFWNQYGGQFLKALSNIWNGIKPIITWVVKFIWDSIKGVIDGVIKFFEGLIKFIAGAFTGDWKTAWDGIKDMIIGALEAVLNFFNLTLFGGIKTLLLNIVKKFGTSFIEIVAKIKAPWANIGKAFEKYSSDMWMGIKLYFKDVQTWFKTNVTDKIANVFINAKEGIASKASEIWSGIKGAFTGAYNWFRDNVASKIRDVLVNWTSTIGSKASAIWNAIKGAFSGVYKWFKDNVVGKIVTAFNNIKDGFKDGIASGLKAVLNEFIGMLNDAIKGLNKLKNKIPGGGHIPDIPSIPKLAKGGITNGPMMAMIGDNPGGREVVSPLDDLQSMIGTAVMSAMKFNQGGGNNTGGDIILNIDGRQFARIVKPHLDKESKRIGTNVKLQPI